MKKLIFSSAILFASLFNAQVNYGFEAAQGYTVGPISGQNGWGLTLATVLGTVSTTTASPGTQSLKLTGNNGTVHTAQGVLSPTVSTAGPVVTVLFNANFQTALTPGDESDFFFSAQSPTEMTINARMHFTYLDAIRVIYTNPVTNVLEYVDTGAVFTRGNWNNYKMELNFATDVVNYYQNNVLIYTGDVVGGTMVGNFAITSDNYNSSAYFDAISAAAGLGTSEVGTKPSAFKIFPNPTTDILNIETPEKINSVSVFDMAGRKMDATLNGKSVDVRSLGTGNYIISIETATGKTSEKFIKK